MRVEHIGVEVTKPFEMAKWYTENLGFKVIYSSEGEAKSNPMVFISDGTGETVFEFFRDPAIRPLCDELSDIAQLHIAVMSDDPDADRDRLAAAGAQYVGKLPTPREGEILISMKDPFGNMIQLVRRGSVKVRK
jgi:glyoxylase I family protein